MDAGKETIDDLSEDEKAEKEKQNEDLEEFRLWFGKVLGERCTRVEASTRLVDSPATLVQSEYGVSPSMQKYLRAQAVVENDDKGQFENIFNQAVLEVNPSHPIIQRLKVIQEIDPESTDAKETAELVFNTAVREEVLLPYAYTIPTLYTLYTHSLHTLYTLYTYSIPTLYFPHNYTQTIHTIRTINYTLYTCRHWRQATFSIMRQNIQLW